MAVQDRRSSPTRSGSGPRSSANAMPRVTTQNLDPVQIRGRTKSGGMIVLRDLPGWEADVRDQGHRKGFVIRIQSVASPLASWVERTQPGSKWADARAIAVQVPRAAANGLPRPEGLVTGIEPCRTGPPIAALRGTRKASNGQRKAAASDQPLLPTLDWPSAESFPHNGGDSKVSDVLLPDLVTARAPLMITAYSSLAKLIPLLADLSDRPQVRSVRLLLGTEPHSSPNTSFRLRYTPSQEVADYWRERGISIAQCGQVLKVIELLERGVLESRTSRPDERPIHGKVYVTDESVVIGSSNFSSGGLGGQHEANVRLVPAHGELFEGATQLGERLWEAGADYTRGLLDLLKTLLQAVTWQDALARACAEILEGTWASRYVGVPAGGALPLWPSQRQGIAQALWVLEHVGGVLIADATGSGKTRMGAYLIAAIMQRFVLGEGRARSDLRPLLICPPGVMDRWVRDNDETGFPLAVSSDGLLSGGGKDDLERLLDKTRRAQVLALDEAHRFLNPTAERTRLLHRNNLADYVLLFTATPVSRGPRDLAAIVNLLGPDNFDDTLLHALSQLLSRRPDADSDVLGPDERESFRRAIQQFTVRRTKSMLNALIDAQPKAFRNVRGDPCRYPSHEATVYACGENDRDRALAYEIQTQARRLRGLAYLQSDITLTEPLRRLLRQSGRTPDDYLRTRLTLARGGAIHRVLSGLRSSNAALYEHLHGTQAALDHFGLERVKRDPTGDVIGKLANLRLGNPPAVMFESKPPDWLASADTYRQACENEIAIYEEIGRLLNGLSDSREQAKADLLTRLLDRHQIVLGFDSHLVTLAALKAQVARVDPHPKPEVAIASGEDPVGRKRVQQWAELRSEARAKIALCSDVMSEGFNLQAASAIVHLDMPTTVRQAEQRVGRVDRLDSPFSTIEAWWPDDAPEFALTTDEKFLARHRFVTDLLGSNMKVPRTRSLRTRDVIQEFAREAETNGAWDKLSDAFDPVRALVKVRIRWYRAQFTNNCERVRRAS